MIAFVYLRLPSGFNHVGSGGFNDDRGTSNAIARLQVSAIKDWSIVPAIFGEHLDSRDRLWYSSSPLLSDRLLRNLSNSHYFHRNGFYDQCLVWCNKAIPLLVRRFKPSQHIWN